ncbi:putative RING finger protein [Panicum miliaceum]|uniref:RING finger protein n=1 Tax=Panicum miliaceum TaxID=4540 RepID=A0A3L6Q1W2_PANMI|nr:putative RING finger protein [Panicum miliaceum]
MEEIGELLMMAVWYFGLGLIYGSLAVMAILLVSEVLGGIQRWRNKLAGERLLDSVADVPYHPLPPDNDAAAAAGEGSPPSCVICIEEYERGERCFVMPGCAHMFHRECMRKWLRQGNPTCPICRATLLVAPALAEERVSTAEDMV